MTTLLEFIDRMPSGMFLGCMALIAAFVCLVLAHFAKRAPTDPTWARRRGIDGEEY